MRMIRSFLIAVAMSIALGLPAHGATVSLTLTWVDNSDNEDGFGIERKIDTGAYAEITRTAADIQIYTDASLLQGTLYCYRVFAFNAFGNSAYSNEACATTPSVPIPPGGLILTLDLTLP